MIEPWQTLSSEPIAGYRIFQVRRDLKRSPRTGAEHDFYILDCPNWVNVVAITAKRELVLIEQYRHGTNSIELEIPGGVMDPEDASPVAAGVRELREETGYEGDRARIIGSVAPNPAFLTNTCYTVLVEGCQLRHPLEFDHAEDVATRLLPLAELPELLRARHIRHSLVLLALYEYERMWEESKK